MKKRSILIGLSIIFSTLSFGQNFQVKLLDSLFTTLYEKKAFNGNVLIAEKGNIVFEKSYGYADESAKRKLDKNTIFELASVSKQFTAMGIVILQKQGKLNYDDKISKYIPELAFYGDISIRNLLNHTSGLPDYM
ncbi:serine hydrolase, partial [Riemerella anatipestifer]|nr:serine hydrolase [Riemerella anatipestifer]MDY3325650.1 serine hydrolase [Riemerella anatipestifer]MDY3353947.1 serine hydrolase [Riemerella anatipestifer]